MSVPIARMADYATGNNHEGVIKTGAETVFIEGSPAAREGDMTACNAYDHSVGMIVTGAQTVFVEGRPLARMGDVTNCGLTIVTGAGTVLA